MADVRGKAGYQLQCEVQLRMETCDRQEVTENTGLLSSVSCSNLGGGVGSLPWFH